MIIGLVGKPSAGKSTFFKALTQAEVLIANYPFATIEPNRGIGFVRVECADKDFSVECNPKTGYCLDGKRFVPVEVIDVAGLVPGAHEGKGMGNKFLDDLRQADVLIHVVDISGSIDEKGDPVKPGSYEPLYDIKFLETELDMWYLSIVKKGWDKFARRAKQEKKDIKKALASQLSGLKVTERIIEDAVRKLELSMDNILEWGEEDLHKLAVFLRKKTKPMIIAANKIDLESAEANFERMKEKHPELRIIPCSAESELALKEAAKKEIIKYVPGNISFEQVKELTIEQENALHFIKHKILDKYGCTGVQECINNAVLNLLQYIAVFPGGVNKLADSKGNVLPDCFLLPPGSTALNFAYKLHTDLGKNFIRAVDVKTKKTVGKDHKLKHRDVIEIVSGR